jgi:hypothetical protein
MSNSGCISCCLTSAQYKWAWCCGTRLAARGVVVLPVSERSLCRGAHSLSNTHCPGTARRRGSVSRQTQAAVGMDALLLLSFLSITCNKSQLAAGCRPTHAGMQSPETPLMQTRTQVPSAALHSLYSQTRSRTKLITLICSSPTADIEKCQAVNTTCCTPPTSRRQCYYLETGLGNTITTTQPLRAHSFLETWSLYGLGTTVNPRRAHPLLWTRLLYDGRRSRVIPSSLSPSSRQSLCSSQATANVLMGTAPARSKANYDHAIRS